MGATRRAAGGGLIFGQDAGRKASGSGNSAPGRRSAWPRGAQWVSTRLRADGITRAEVGDQGLGRRDLPLRRRLLVEVADEADSDAILVDLGVLGIPAVNPMLLVDPALGDLDLAVCRFPSRCRSRSDSRSRHIPEPCGARRRSGRSCRRRWHCGAGRCTARGGRPCWDRRARCFPTRQGTGEAAPVS